LGQTTNAYKRLEITRVCKRRWTIVFAAIWTGTPKVSASQGKPTSLTGRNFVLYGKETPIY